MHIDDAPRGLHRGFHPHGNPKRTGNALRHERYTADAIARRIRDLLGSMTALGRGGRPKIKPRPTKRTNCARQQSGPAGVAKSTRITASAALKGVMDGRPSMRSVATPP